MTMRRASHTIGTALARLALVALPVAGLAGCESLLEVQAPSRVIASTLEKPATAKLLVDGARAAFGCVYQAYITGTALLTDEMEDTQLAAAAWPWDRRDWSGSLGQAYAESSCDAGQIFGVYTPLQVARFAADDAANKVSGFTDAEVPGRQALVAEANLLAGFSRVLLAEGFCSAAIDGGPELQPGAVFAAAEPFFTAAIAAANTAGNASIRDAALVGRARARLGQARLPGQAVNQTKYNEAKADAQAVTNAGFVYNIPYNGASSYARNNIAQRNRLNLLYGVAPQYRGLNDPRVQVTQGARGADAVSTVWYADKYPDITTPIALARYAVAQLIVAEAEWAAGNHTAAVNILNANRGRAGVNLPPYTGPMDATSVRDFLIAERSKELFLEGYHFWDINRFNLPLVPAPGTPYPIKGGTYADLRCLPLPDIERINNPNI
jgi:starch-binding outer membrane protein, SusD/RagB family